MQRPGAILVAGLALAGQMSCHYHNLPCPSPETAKEVKPEKHVRRFVIHAFRKLKSGKLRQKVDTSAWKFVEGTPDLPAGLACLAPPIAYDADQIRVSSEFRDKGHVFMPGDHTGIDITAEVGTPVLAAAAGKVTVAFDARDEEAWYVTVGIGGGWKYRVLHLSRLAVRTGETVTTGQVLGWSGGEVDDPGAGEYTTGSHLHFDLSLNGAFTDPRPYFCGAPLRKIP